MLTLFDNIIVIIAFALSIGVALYFSRTVKDMESFFVCNKTLPWALTVGTLVATWYGGVGTLGSVEWFALFGVSMWLMYCVTAHVGRIPMALWVGPKMQIRTDITVPDLLQKTYGKIVAILGACLMLIYTFQFGNLTTASFVGEVAWGISGMTIAIIVAVIVVVIAVASGLMGVAVTDMMMFFFLGITVAITVPLAWGDAGGFAGIEKSLGDAADTLLDPIGGLGLFEALTFALLGLAVYADPAFYQRFSASDSPASGRRALLTCICIWILMDIVLIATGLIVAAEYPHMDPGPGYVALELSTLPIGLKALFVVALIGSAISALDSYFLVGGTTFAYDIYGKIKKNCSQKELLFATRISIVGIGILAVLVSDMLTIANEMMFITSASWTAGAVVPVAGALLYKGKKTPAGGFFSLLLGAGSYFVFYFMPITSIPALENPLPLCFAISFVAFVIGNRFGKPIYKQGYLEV